MTELAAAKALEAAKEVKDVSSGTDGVSLPRFENKELSMDNLKNDTGEAQLSPLKRDIPNFSEKNLDAAEKNDNRKLPEAQEKVSDFQDTGASSENNKERTLDDSNQEKTDLKDKNDSNEYPSTYEERINHTPVDGERGNWTGERGESDYIPSENSDVKNTLEKFGRDGVEYSNGIPDFEPFSAETVEIENMSDRRLGKGGNFDQADEMCAKKWNEENRDGKNDWTKEDIQDWRDENGYSWHECNDMKTCQLVPTEINDYFGHLGGVSECKKTNTERSKFDA